MRRLTTAMQTFQWARLEQSGDAASEVRMPLKDATYCAVIGGTPLKQFLFQNVAIVSFNGVALSNVKRVNVRWTYIDASNNNNI